MLTVILLVTIDLTLLSFKFIKTSYFITIIDFPLGLLQVSKLPVLNTFMYPTLASDLAFKLKRKDFIIEVSIKKLLKEMYVLL